MAPTPSAEGVRNNNDGGSAGGGSQRDNDSQQWDNLPENARAQAVFVRPANEVEAMSWGQRAGKRVKNIFGGGGKKRREDAPLSSTAGETGGGGGAAGQPNHNDDDEEEESYRPVQYRLEATRVPVKQNLLCRILTCCGLFGGKRQSGLVVGINPNQKLAMFLHWMFRVNFLFLFAVMCSMFFALVILFAGFIAMAGSIDAECVRIGKCETSPVRPPKYNISNERSCPQPFLPCSAGGVPYGKPDFLVAAQRKNGNF